jgi:uncharacterized protein
MKLRVHEIQDAGVFDASLAVAAGEVPLETPDHPQVAEDVKVEVHAETLKNAIELGAQVSARVRIECSRCLESFVLPLQTRFDVEVPLQQAFIDISEETRQALMLALPPKPLCRPECMGLCPKCGKNLNRKLCDCPTDKPSTPFEKLKEFRPK